MRAVVQRVKEAQVTVDNKITGSIKHGLLILLGVHKDDKPEDTSWLVQKIVNLRIFEDAQEKINLSVKDVQGEVLVVSQFTLYANCNTGRRPDFIAAAPPAIAIPIYEKFVDEIKQEMGAVQTGIFGAYMQISLVNDGPFTMIVENSR
jgi:D-aminoacyl-tRNA deacylase